MVKSTPYIRNITVTVLMICVMILSLCVHANSDNNQDKNLHENEYDFSGVDPKYRDSLFISRATAPEINISFDNALENKDIFFNKDSRDTIQYVVGGYVLTRDGTQVTYYSASRDFTSSEIAAINNYINTVFPNVTVVSQPSSKFNCHSYAWYDPSSSNIHWIDDVYSFVNDAHSSSVSSPSVGNLVVYLSGDNSIVHSAIITDITGTNITVVSKWGQYGVYSHLITYVPSDYYYSSGSVVYAVLSYLDHSYGQYSYNATLHYHTCSLCNETVAEAHRFFPYGETRRCRVCGYIEGISPIDSDTHLNIF